MARIDVLMPLLDMRKLVLDAKRRTIAAEMTYEYNIEYGIEFTFI